MAFLVTDPDYGFKIKINSDTPPSEQELNGIFKEVYKRKGILRQKASKDEYLSTEERLSTGFRAEPEKYLEQKRTELGLAPGTPLEPSGFNLENILDLPNDMVDMVGPAFPALGQFFGNIAGATAGAVTAPETGGTSLPALTAAGGIAGAAGGDYLRQALGHMLWGFEDPVSAGRIGSEAMFAGIGEAIPPIYKKTAGKLLSKAFEKTKKGILKSSDKILSQKGADKFTRISGNLLLKINPEETQFAINALRKGDNRVMDSFTASDDFAKNFAKDLFFGKDGDTVKQIIRLSRNPKKNKDAIKILYNKFTGLSPETIDTIISNPETAKMLSSAVKSPENFGKLLLKARDEAALKLKAAKQKEFNSFGKALNAALSKDGDKIVDFTDVNNKLINTLIDRGVINPKTKSVAEAYAKTPVGKIIEDIFERFGKGSRSKSTLASTFTPKASQTPTTLYMGPMSDLPPHAQEMIRAQMAQKEMMASEKIATQGKMIIPENELSFGRFKTSFKNAYNLWRDTKKQNNLKSFFKSTAPELAAPFAEYFDDLAFKLGSSSQQLAKANARYKAFITRFRPIESISKNKIAFTEFLNSLTPDSVFTRGIKELDNLLPAHLRLSKTILTLNAMKELRNLANINTKNTVVDNFASFMGKAFDKNNVKIFDDISHYVDPYLPSAYKITNKAQTHSVAKSLHKSAVSLLRARWLTSGLGLSAMLSLFLPAQAALTATMAAGILLQNPALFRTMIRAVSQKYNIAEPVVAQQLKSRLSQIVSQQQVRNKERIVSQVISNILRMQNR